MLFQWYPFLCRFVPCEPWARILVFSSKKIKKIPLRVFFTSWRKREDEGMSLRSMRTLGSNPLFFFEEIKNTLAGLFYFLAEARGFEPPRHCCPHHFESCAFNHSATLPLLILSHPTPKDKHAHQLIPQNHLFTSIKSLIKNHITKRLL